MSRWQSANGPQFSTVWTATPGNKRKQRAGLSPGELRVEFKPVSTADTGAHEMHARALVSLVHMKHRCTRLAMAAIIAPGYVGQRFQDCVTPQTSHALPLHNSCIKTQGMCIRMQNRGTSCWRVAYAVSV